MARVEKESRVFMTMDKGIANIQAYSPDRFAGLFLVRPIANTLMDRATCGRLYVSATQAFVARRVTGLLHISPSWQKP